jgi:hypothetical protein
MKYIYVLSALLAFASIKGVAQTFKYAQDSIIIDSFVETLFNYNPTVWDSTSSMPGERFDDLARLEWMYIKVKNEVRFEKIEYNRDGSMAKQVVGYCHFRANHWYHDCDQIDAEQWIKEFINLRKSLVMN